MNAVIEQFEQCYPVIPCIKYMSAITKLQFSMQTLTKKYLFTRFCHLVTSNVQSNNSLNVQLNLQI